MTAETQRIDKWLWFARMLKTRTAAAKLAAAGKVRVNGTRLTKPSQTILVDDVLTFTINHQVRILKVLDLGKRRGPYEEARQLYEDLAPVSDDKGDAKEATASEAPDGARDPGAGRPTKKQRRELDEWRSSEN